MELALARQRLCLCPAARLEKEFGKLKSRIGISSSAYWLAAGGNFVGNFNYSLPRRPAM